MNLFFPFYSDMKPHATKRQVTTQENKKKIDIETLLNQVLNIHILSRNSTNRWVDFKTTHQLDECTQNLQVHIH
jgi:hypothetical protein